jgi:hypothetical protein
MTHTTREILTALQYLAFGLVAFCVVLRWFSHYSFYWQILAWLIMAGGASLIRIILLVATEWFSATRWQSIRRRNWD